jgi:hypothetical protein
VQFSDRSSTRKVSVEFLKSACSLRASLLLLGVAEKAMD